MKEKKGSGFFFLQRCGSALSPCKGVAWLGLAWLGVSSDLAWLGLARLVLWLGLARVGSARLGLAWPGWLGLAWLGVAWLGLAWLGCRLRFDFPVLPSRKDSFYRDVAVAGRNTWSVYM